MLPGRFLSSSPPGLTRWSMPACGSQWIAGSSPAMTNCWTIEPPSLHHAVFGVGIAVVREHLLDDLGLVFAVRPLGDLGQIEVLDRIVIVVELEGAAQRLEVGLLQRRPQCVLVGEIAFDR